MFSAAVTVVRHPRAEFMHTLEPRSLLSRRDFLVLRIRNTPTHFGEDPKFPRHEFHGLAAQLQRAAVSIPSNIAEGSARQSTKEFIYFLRVSRGSMAELETQLLLAQRIGYLSESEVAGLQLLIDEVGRILNTVVAGLRRRLGKRSD